jgi:hypothetical protein|uniref:Baseplate structural protein n=1 Tax=Myoviridae sp. ctsip2 TaxID=2826705 RepID=A0A8S5N656_9CAUD|nr:MAG TPA: Baseplate structural protein [Myoviridae sp. ctsip2]
MPKIERKTQKIFGGNAESDQLAVFGSMITGTPVYNDDVETLQSEAYTEGWQVAVAANEAPFMEEMNGVQYGFSKQLAYLFQQGIAEWDAGTTYYLNSFCQVGGVIYKSMQDENINHSPADDTEGTYWIPLETGSGGDGGGLEVCDIGMSLYIDETKGLRRWLNGQIVAINQNTQGFLTRLKKIVALYPSLLTTEENWQAAKTLSAFGQVGKFVFNYAEDEETVESVRLPAVVNVQGLIDLQNLGVTVAAGLPNITGTSNGYCTAQTSNGSGVSGCIYNIPLSVIQGATNNAGWSAKFGIDASLSNSIYGATDTVQEEAIQYPYFIQIATGQETEVNIRNDIESIVPYTLFDSKYSEAKQYNASWVLRGSILSKSVYPTAYEAALVEYNSEVADGTTVELPSGGSYTKRGVSGGITVKLSTDETVTEYDWKLDTVAETLTVPTLNGSEDLLSDRYDDLELKASGSTYTAPANGWFWIQKLSSSTVQYLTPVIKDSNGNIKYTLTSQPTSVGYDAEILAPVSKGDVISIGYNVGGATKSFRFIYAKGNGSLYFFVASVAQNAPLANLGRIEETKVDKNSSWGFPSNRYIDLELGASGSTYTAPANGYFCWNGIVNNSYIVLTIGATDVSNVDNAVKTAKRGYTANSASGEAKAFVAEVAKNTVIHVWFGGNFISGSFKFIFAEGSN